MTYAEWQVTTNFGFLRGGEADANLAKLIHDQGLTEYARATQVVIILLFSLVGIAGSYAVAWFGTHGVPRWTTVLA